LSAPLSFDDVPDHDFTVTRSRGEVVGVLNEIESGDLGGVSLEGEQERHVSVVPNLDGLIPRGSDTDGWLLGLVESNAGNGISVSILVNSMFALRSGVPNLDFLVQTSSDDLSVIWGEIDGENISLVTNKLADGSSGSHVPESDGSVPRGGESEARVAGELDLTDEVRVSSQQFLWFSHWGIIFKFSILSEVPLNEGLITRSREEELLHLSVNLFLSNSEGGDPATVTLEESLVNEFVLLLSLIFH